MTEMLDEIGRMLLTPDVRARFDARVLRAGPDDCWPWDRPHPQLGYGRFYIGGGRAAPLAEYTHRIVLFYKTGTWGRVGRHSCDNPPCCNAAHLAWGTHKDNSQDALRKCRAYVGEANSNARYTDAQVADVVRLRCGGATYREIEEQLGIPRKSAQVLVVGRGAR